jgi:hypothetical protein
MNNAFEIMNLTSYNKSIACLGHELFDEHDLTNEFSLNVETSSSLDQFIS